MVVSVGRGSANMTYGEAASFATTSHTSAYFKCDSVRIRSSRKDKRQVRVFDIASTGGPTTTGPTTALSYTEIYGYKSTAQ
eukprot:11123-Eustigmatos_ZCMA.PRE.1